MSEQHSINISAHYNIYTGNSNRELRIDFSTPQNGVTESTGLIIFVSGFGGNIDSNVYAKMRKVFADKYNMVTIQCSYFGSTFMQSSADRFWLKNPEILQSILTVDELEKMNKDPSILLSILSEKNILLPVIANIDESIEEFNDMSYMQAIDIISSVEAVKTILKGNNLIFNPARIIGYGHSHGAYLLHLSNRLAPNLFSYLVDNSAWIEPAFLSNNRFLYGKVGNATFAIEFDYIAKKIIPNRLDLNLETLYKDFHGNTQVLSFQGDNDDLVNHLEKKRIVETINNSDFILVKQEDVDHVKYKSNSHGLDADFLELFSFALELERPTKEAPVKELIYIIDFESVLIEVDYTNGLPIFNFNFK
ncbi:DUF2920 family protein [Paenibacillus polymyxa]|uniref:DUF2920 family protein n=1 Tax=Paenibacillus polymyxa TaxID=1406 RepID=UPI002024592E|nr:DUF2920 family protein [Paenibacillus polymyxa]URJ47933.3 DUF2920 family protein [Paenibacillus polymyxa]